jgi:hypothetical protein
MSTQKPEWLTERLDNLLSGDMNTLEGEAEALELWNLLRSDPVARSEYDGLIFGLRGLSPQKGKKTFTELEAEVLWPVLMAQVAEDAKRRSGLSKRALQHLAVPQLVASISAALTQYSQSKPTEGVETKILETTVSESAGAQRLDFSIARVGGEVAFRLYRQDEVDVRAQVTADEVTSNMEAGGDWDSVSKALSELSQVTSNLLGEDVLVNGRIAIENGRAEVFLNPANVVRQTK